MKKIKLVLFQWYSVIGEHEAVQVPIVFDKTCIVALNLIADINRSEKFRVLLISIFYFLITDDHSVLGNLNILLRTKWLC
jgi:hypothetical protein